MSWAALLGQLAGASGGGGSAAAASALAGGGGSSGAAMSQLLPQLLGSASGSGRTPLTGSSGASSPLSPQVGQAAAAAGQSLLRLAQMLGGQAPPGGSSTAAGAGGGGASSLPGGSAVNPAGGWIKTIEQGMTAFADQSKKLGQLIAKPTEMFSLALEGLTAAIKAPVAALQSLGNSLSQFVSAFNPSTAFAFELASRNLTAMIGSALEPALRGVISVAQAMNEAFTPIMRELSPIISRLSAMFAQISTVIFNAMSPGFSYAIDLFSLLVSAMEPLVPLFQGVVALMAGFTDMWASFVYGILGSLGLDVTNLFSDMTRAVRYFVGAALQATGQLLKVADSIAGTDMAGSFARGVAQALTGLENSSGTVAAPRNAQVGGIEAFAQNLTRSALLAMPQGADSDKEEERRWRQEVVAGLQQIAGGNDAIVQAIEQAGQSLANSLMSSATAASSPLNPLGRVSVDSVFDYLFR